MRPSLPRLKTAKSLLAKAWRPRPLESDVPTIISGRHPELFTSQIILSDGSSYRVKSTAPREQVKITKDTRSHPLWNPHTGLKISDEGGYLSTFQKKFQGFNGSDDLVFVDDVELASGSSSKKATAGTDKKK
ncbi:hypothetical protein GGI21_002030 [Coemansia aciculifera]|uniref:Uncharacterized protein n=1 Tax=Coemansia aciculifera TaxID=417176 RepID=A0ACC1M158_9FUNG|nr:hypothetical protein IWW38_003299 [Coemansia aciculifera]KAJ2909291.1 hypothetical protein GGI21_002030 [Coemansia aciculifera]